MKDIEELKKEFFADLENKDESFVVSKWILHSTPFIFTDNIIKYIEWKESLSKRINVDSRAICLTGSSCIGFSLNPNKDFKYFDDKSDIDVAVISNYYFDISWHYLRNMGTKRYDLDSEQKLAVQEHVNRLIYWGTIATDKILTILPFGDEWFKALQEMSNEEITLGRDIKVRIYKDYEAFRAYNNQNVKKMKMSYISAVIKKEELK